MRKCLISKLFGRIGYRQVKQDSFWPLSHAIPQGTHHKLNLWDSETERPFRLSDPPNRKHSDSSGCSAQADKQANECKHGWRRLKPGHLKDSRLALFASRRDCYSTPATWAAVSDGKGVPQCWNVIPGSIRAAFTFRNKAILATGLLCSTLTTTQPSPLKTKSPISCSPFNSVST